MLRKGAEAHFSHVSLRGEIGGKPFNLSEEHSVLYRVVQWNQFKISNDLLSPKNLTYDH